MAVVAVVALAVGARAAPAPTRAGDLVELRRQAMNGGASAVAPGLASADRATVLGAIAGADAAPDAWELLEGLAAVAGDWDRSTAAPAAQAAARIARGLDAARVVLLDVPDDRLEAAAVAWWALAARADRWTDVRVHALEVAIQVEIARSATADTAPDVTTELLGLVADPDPEVRRAVLELLPIPLAAGARAVVVARVVTEPAPALRLAAAAALCAALPDDHAAVLAALGSAGREALRGAVAAPISGAAAIGVARCLAADSDPRAQRALIQLRQMAPAAVRPVLAR